MPARHLPVAPVVLAPNVDHADHANRVAPVVPVAICVAAALAADMLLLTLAGGIALSIKYTAAGAVAGVGAPGVAAGDPQAHRRTRHDPEIPHEIQRDFVSIIAPSGQPCTPRRP